MDKDNQKQSSTGRDLSDAAARESLANVLHGLTSMRRVQESSSLRTVSEESFTSTMSSRAEKKTVTSLATMASSSSHSETTGGKAMLTDEDKTPSVVGSPMMMELGACPMGRAMFAQQQQKQQSSIASSTSSIASTSLETMRKTKTLSFLHNEDLFATGSGAAMIAADSGSGDDKLIPTASHLFRSISFQEQRRQVQKSSLQRAESGRESTGDANSLRKMAILSPKHSLQELNERMKQHHMRVQQQMFYGSSELSM
jgi:hypothetical protein